MTASILLRRISRVLRIATAICVGGAQVWSAEDKPAAHHEHPATSGVCSLDVYADLSRLHLLTGEFTEGSERPVLLYRHSEDGGATWAQPARVDAGLPPPFSPHRGMDAQIAAAGDRVIAVWTTAGTDQWGSGPMVTALSSDGGKTWRAGPNPADDSSTTGHGFIDIAADHAGVFHLTWLDSRDGKQGLRYARSEDGGKSWSKNVTVKAATCECCSNAIVAGADGKVAILFRDGNPRDMRLVQSRDRGQRWLPPVAAGGFDWQFNGCPHVGGGLALAGKDETTAFHALVWTGKADRTGIYHVAIPDNGQPASAPTQLGDVTASHPDLAGNAQGHIAAVWDSRASETPGIWGAVSTGAGESWSKPRRLSAPEATATHPRVVTVRDGFRVFWTEERAGRPAVWASANLP